MSPRRVAGRRPQAGGDGAPRDRHRDLEGGRHTGTGPAARDGARAEYRYRRGGHELVLSSHDLTGRQAEAVAGGEAEFALVVEGPLLVLGYRFGEAIPWSATAPFHWHWLPPEERVVPPEVELTPETFARLWGTLWITLVEADGGRVRARRAVALSPPFPCALLEALRRQATQPLLSYAGMHALARLSQAPEGLPRRAASLTRCAAVSPPRTDSPSSLVLPSTPMYPQVSRDPRAMDGAHASARHASSRIIIVPVGRWSSLPDLGTRRTGTVPVGPETG